MSEHNRKIIEKFVRNKRLAGVKEGTIQSNILAAQPFFVYFRDADFDTITPEQVEDWYLWYVKTPSKQTNKPPMASTVQGVCMIVRQILASMHGKDEARKMMENIKPKRAAKVTVREAELLTEDEIKRMMEVCTDDRDRAMIAFLYSTGCRVGEFVSLRIRDVKLGREFASIHIPEGKTGERDIDIFLGVPELKRWLQVHPYRDNPDAPLFPPKILRGNTVHPMNRKSVCAQLERIAIRAGIPEDKRYNPHSFRHKRATDLADDLTTADLRVLFGWSDMSNTPNVYIHSSRGKVKRKLAEIAGVKVPETVRPSSMVRQCPVCGAVNAANATWCINCTATLDEHLARTEKQTEEYMMKRMREKQESK